MGGGSPCWRGSLGTCLGSRGGFLVCQSHRGVLSVRLRAGPWTGEEHRAEEIQVLLGGLGGWVSGPGVFPVPSCCAGRVTPPSLVLPTGPSSPCSSWDSSVTPVGCGDPGAVTCPIGGSSSCTPGCPGPAPAPAPAPGGAGALAVGRDGGQWTGMASTLTRLSLCRGSRPRRLQDQDGHL